MASLGAQTIGKLDGRVKLPTEWWTADRFEPCGGASFPSGNAPRPRPDDDLTRRPRRLELHLGRADVLGCDRNNGVPTTLSVSAGRRRRWRTKTGGRPAKAAEGAREVGDHLVRSSPFRLRTDARSSSPLHQTVEQRDRHRLVNLEQRQIVGEPRPSAIDQIAVSSCRTSIMELRHESSSPHISWPRRHERRVGRSDERGRTVSIDARRGTRQYDYPASAPLAKPWCERPPARPTRFHLRFVAVIGRSCCPTRTKANGSFAG